MSSILPCPSEVCEQHRERIAAFRRDLGRPPGEPVLLVQPDGTVCSCTCAGAAADAAAEADAALEAVEPCPDRGCYRERQMIDICQGLPPGQSVIIEQPGGGHCFCSCWGGRLAPLTVADGEGVQVPLDAVPVGGFVMAAGLELEWRRMLLRWAWRPYQRTPQPAWEVTVAGGSMRVHPGHIFLTAQSKLILARQLDLSIPLMAPDRTPVPVERIEEVSTLDVFQALATSNGGPGAELEWHLLDTQGVVSADHAVEKAYRQRRLPRRLLAFPYGR